MNRRLLPALLLGAVLLLPGVEPPATAAAPEGVPSGSPGIARAGRVRSAQDGEITPEKLERWRKMTPEQQERIRERYRRWKSLPPEEREQILERRRAWRSLPEAERSYLRGRREILRKAGPEERRAIRKFTRRVRKMPPDRRRWLHRRIGELRNIPAAERDERLMEWEFYRGMSPAERRAVSRFLFSEPTGSEPAGSRERVHE